MSTASNEELLRHAFVLLASAETGAVPEWRGPDFAPHLQARVELLALLMNVIPRSQLGRLAEVMIGWRRKFPEPAALSATALRDVAHAILRDTSSEFGSPASMAAVRRVEAILNVRIDPAQDGNAVPAISATARQQCAVALCAWQNQLKTSITWTSLPGVVPGDSPSRIEDAYVDLHACPRDDFDRVERLRGFGRAIDGRTRSTLATPSFGAAAMVGRTLNNCVVLGEPGSGKSTLIQWLAWATNEGRLHDFDVALVVKLRHYATILSDRPQITLLECFLESVQPNITDWKETADCLRQTAAKSRRVLLLLDGWDEVPASQRERTRERIQEESPHFVVIVTSRVSGLPRQIFLRGTAEFYEIAGLAPQAIRSFVEKQLRAVDQSGMSEMVIGRIEHEPDLRGMAANPFVLGLLVRLLSRHVHTGEPLTLAQLFRQIVDWVVEHHRQQPHSTGRVVGEHLRALERLSFLLVYAAESPRYAFQRRELDATLETIESSSLVESRLINRLDAEFDSWSFLHATLEEFFAASHLAMVPDDEWSRAWDRSFCSQSRLLVLEFLAGIGGNESRRSSERARYWLKNSDRFGLSLLRLARLAIAGQWVLSLPPLANEIQEKLWAQIVAGDDWRLGRRFVEAFAAMNPLALVRRASSSGKVDVRIWETICDVVPLDVIEQGGLYDVLPSNMRDYVALHSREPRSQERIDWMLAMLSDYSLPTPDLLRIVDQAALMAEQSIAVALLARLRVTSDENVRMLIVMALARIFAQLPMPMVLSLVTDEHDLPPTVVQMACATLSHADGRGRLLEPDGRDRLLRRLAVLRPGDVRVPALLVSLKNFPIRDGGGLIAELAVSQEIDLTVRVAAIDVLHTVSDLEAVRHVVMTIPGESSERMIPSLLALAEKRAIGVPREWLEQRVHSNNESLQRRALLAIYVGMMMGSVPRERIRFREFLAKQVHDALSGGSTEDEDRSFELAHAFNAKPGSSRILWDSRQRPDAEGVLREFMTAGLVVPTGKVLLAIALIRHESQPRWIESLRRTLNAALSFLRKASEKRMRINLETIAQAVGESLGDSAVGQLLSYPPSCEPVRDVLAGLARDSGWMVFDDRIVDAHGNELVTTGAAFTDGKVLSPEAFLGLLERLPDSPRKAITSYWLITRAMNVCDENATYKEIHATLHRIAKGDDGNATEVERVREIYPKRPPTFDAWRQAINRAIQELRILQNGANFLIDLGLPRRR